VHNYGKHTVKPYRKMGHLTVVASKGESQEELIVRSKELIDKVKIIPED
jgi:phosphoribosylaminoimidazole carboxylase (NCAIR synthetase)